MIEVTSIKVSVIIPVYNAEEFLRETLDTVVNQTLREIEIICVDDGSTDSSLDILNEYAVQYESITVLQQKNQFAGSARNYGLEKSIGKYIVFWDSDDLFALDALEVLYQQCEKDEADICICNAFKMNSDTKEIIVTDVYLMKDYLPDIIPFSKHDIPQYIFNFASNVPWNKMFRREFVEADGLRFDNLRQANDTYFILMSLFFAKRITYVDKELIWYRVDNDSSLTGKASDTIFCAYQSYLNVFEKLSSYDEFQGELKQGFVNRAIAGFIYSLISQQDFEAYQRLYKFLVNEGFQTFGIINYEEEYFFKGWHYTYLQNMLEMTPEQFLLWEVRKRKKDMAHRATRIQKLKEKIIQKNMVIQNQKNKLNCLPVRIALKILKIVTLNGRLGTKYRNIF